jgi:hypothetical protein
MNELSILLQQNHYATGPQPECICARFSHFRAAENQGGNIVLIIEKGGFHLHCQAVAVLKSLCQTQGFRQFIAVEIS